MSPSAVYYSPSTTSHVQDGLLQNTLRRFTVFAPTNHSLGHQQFLWQSSQKDLRSFHRWCDIRHLLESKIPYRSYTSKKYIQNRPRSLKIIFLIKHVNRQTNFWNHLKQYPRKTCQVIRLSFEITQIRFFIKHAH